MRTTKDFFPLLLFWFVTAVIAILVTTLALLVQSAHSQDHVYRDRYGRQIGVEHTFGSVTTYRDQYGRQLATKRTSQQPQQIKPRIQIWVIPIRK